ncbi:thioredoxin fold domain-containing protein [SAR92 clade bacterium H921]|nr:thioredoxin fold domain-containing protein [SAR92 clade bacterium H921]
MLKTNSISFKLALGAVITGLVLLSEVTVAEVPNSVINTITDRLSSARSDLSFRVVGRAPIQGFYEVQIQSGAVLYVSADGEYFFDGDLYKVNADQFLNMREVRLKAERQALFASRSTGDMIIFKPAEQTKAVMNVFTDVDCGYCRKLHREVPELNAYGIEVRYLAYPRAGIPSETYDKMATAWCAKDQQDILTRVKNGDDIATAVCDNNPVAEHFALGRDLGVSGTPSIILMDGTMIPGYQPAADLAKIFGLAEPDY